ncbi:MAG TPA: putative zinc-binding peptidase [Puia sp.]|nr:putative zinc-binding peptidase [Puia sp.]
MKLYSCQNCGQLLYFENSFCISCQHPVGFDADRLLMITLEKTETGVAPENEGIAGFADITDKTVFYTFCRNAGFGTCNWLIPARQAHPFCQACQLNRIIPPLSDPEMWDRWKRIEMAKHRLVYSLLRLRLPLFPKTAGGMEGVPDTESGIAFDFMADVPAGQRVMTGHAGGVITLNIEEADEVERVRNKRDLGEKYRTLLGHLRHETGHYYWDQLIRDSPSLPAFRLLFGDERPDYGEALQNYYRQGAPESWVDHFISPYASAHPWEDWAETWSHYMHLIDTLETAYAFGISIHPGKARELKADIREDPYLIKDFHEIIELWLPLTFAINSLNRSMGHPDFYPFVISPVIVEKLRFIHERVRSRMADR